MLSFNFQRCHLQRHCNLRTTIFNLIDLCAFTSFLALLPAVWLWRARGRILVDWAFRFHWISVIAAYIVIALDGGRIAVDCASRRHRAASVPPTLWLR